MTMDKDLDLSRRSFVKRSGTLLVGLGAAAAVGGKAQAADNPLKGNLPVPKVPSVRVAAEDPRPYDALDFEAEFSAVRSLTPAGEARNELAFATLCDQLRSFSTRGGIRKVWFGRSNGLPYWLNTNVVLADLEDVIFIFDTGPEFSGSPDKRGIYWGWSGDSDGTMFSLVNSTGTIQRGLHWHGSWTFMTNKPDHGDMLLVDGVNNWGGPYSVISLTSQGNTKRVRRGLVLNRTLPGLDNAHATLGAFYSGGAKEGALYAISGDVSIDRGNISFSEGEKGVYIGPASAEVKLKKGLKIDGGGDIAVDLQGSYCEVECQFELHSDCVGILLDRAVNVADCGRYNWLGGRFVGDGTSRAWIARNTGGGGMFGNHLNYPGYANVLDQSKTADATVLPNGVSLFDDGGDYYRHIVRSEYRDGGGREG
jgi:hypothetical protein